MTTYRTGNPIGSTDARDRLDNTENMDYLENSTTKLTHPDRLGTVRKTRHGMEAEHDAQISAHEVEHDNQMQSFESDFDGRLAGMAFTRVGSFTAGATLTDMRQVLVWGVSQGGDGHEYGWNGAFPKVVAAGSTPATSGGIGAGAWVDRTDLTLRSDINIVIKRFTSVAEMVADTSLTIGQSVETVGYLGGWGASSSGRPKGGNTYVVVPANTGLNDGGSFINATNGLQLKAIFPNDIVDVCQFGVVGDGSDEAAKIKASLSIGKPVVVDGLTVSIGSVGQVQNYTSLKCINGGKFNLLQTSTPFYFVVSNTTGCKFDIAVSGNRGSFAYVFTTGSSPETNSRSRYSPIYGVGVITDLDVKIHASELYSAAIYTYSGIDTTTLIGQARRISISGECTNSNFELASLLYCGDVKFDNVLTYGNTNTSGNTGLVANGVIVHGCDNVSVTERCNFGSCDGTNFKIENANGLHSIGPAYFVDAGFNGIHLQQSASELPFVGVHQEKIVLNNPIVIGAKNWAISGSSNNANSVNNVSGSIINQGCALGGVICSGSNWDVSVKCIAPPVADSSGTYRNSPAVTLENASGTILKNNIFKVFYDAYNAEATLNSSVVEICKTVATAIDGLDVSGYIRNHKYRGVGLTNNARANNVRLHDLEFIKDTPDGTATWDIYASSNISGLHWVVMDSNSPQGVNVNISGTGSTVRGDNITPTWPNAVLGFDATNQYYCQFNGGKSPFYDKNGRWNYYGTTAPISGNFNVGDTLWNTAPTSSSYEKWICTVAGSPGTWKGSGLIA